MCHMNPDGYFWGPWWHMGYMGPFGPWAIISWAHIDKVWSMCHRGPCGPWAKTLSILAQLMRAHGPKDPMGPCA
jgi:hypothetical protein